MPKLILRLWGVTLCAIMLGSCAPSDSAEPYDTPLLQQAGLRQLHLTAAEQQFAESLRLSLLQGNAFAAGNAANNLGSLRLDAGDLDGAMSYYQIALEIDPGNADAVVNFAVCLLLQARQDVMAADVRIAKREKAANLIQMALEKYPNRALYWANAGVVWMDLGQHGKAEAAYRRSLSLDPSEKNSMTRKNLEMLTAGAAVAKEPD